MGRRTAAWVVVALVALLLTWWFLRRRGVTPETAQSIPDSVTSGRFSASAGGAGIAPGVVAGLPKWFGQKGIPPRRIAGRVTNEGKPFAGAEVRLSTWVTRTGDIAEPVLRTGSDGRFDFGLWPAWTYWVDAQAPGLSPDHVGLDLRDPTRQPPPDDLELKLGPCNASLYGSVRDAAGGRIMGARILVTLPTGFGLERGGAEAISEAKGAYDLCVPIGNLQTEVSADGYGSILVTGLVHGRTRRDFTLIPDAIISGKVVRLEDGAPVAGTPVGVWAMSWAQLSPAPRIGKTDANGRFRLTGVAAGRHRVTAQGDELTLVKPVDVVVEAAHTAEVTLQLTAATRVSGIVVEQNGGKPVAGATVNLFAPSGGDSQLSQSDGSFILHVPKTTFDVRVEPWEIASPKKLEVTRDLSGVRLEVNALGSVSGRVTYKGEPVDGAMVQLGGPGSFRKALSEPDGRYHIRGLPPGTYHVFADSPRHEAFGEAHPDQFPLAAREQLDGKDIELNFAGSIAGVVVDQKGAPVAGVWVNYDLVGGSDSGGSGTAADGSYVATKMTGGGDYRPVVRPAESSPIKYPPASGGDVFPVVPLRDGATHIEGVRLQVRYDRISISGNVTDGGGKPLPDVRVLAAAQEGDQPAQFFLWQDLPAATTILDGSFTIGELPQGTYSLQARAGDGSTAVARNIPAGKQGVTIVLSGTGGIDGEVVGFRAKPDIRAFRVAEQVQDMLNPSLDGTHFQLRGLEPGRYRVNATSPDGADAQIATVQAGVVANVTLRSHGIGSIAGRVVDWRTGAAAAGLECNASIAAGSESWPGPGVGAQANEQGAFVMEAAPAGSLRLQCTAAGTFYSDGRVWVTLATGGHADVQVPVVKRQLPRVSATIQATFDMMLDVPKIAAVIPGGAADKAGVKSGDVIVAVDGLAIDKLTPWGVMMFIVDRAIGSTARLSLLRAGHTITANVVVASEF